MTEYRYRATDPFGKEQEGTVNSFSLDAARAAVSAMGLEPVEIYEAAAPVLPDPPTFALYSDLQKVHEKKNVDAAPEARAYFPLLDTLRLYAGWLLAWYCLVYAVGSYQFMRELPVRIPYADSLFLSPLVLSFTFAAYLFLLLSGWYVSAGRKKPVAIVLLAVGVGLFLLYRMNVN